MWIIFAEFRKLGRCCKDVCRPVITLRIRCILANFESKCIIKKKILIVQTLNKLPRNSEQPKVYLFPQTSNN